MIAKALGKVRERLRGVRALVRLLMTVRKDRDDPAHVARSLEALDARLKECRGVHVTVLSDGCRVARRM
jgi:hypothetical protein